MNDTLLRYWWMLALRGGIAIAFGMLALMLPGLTVLSFIALFSAYALFSGALWTIGAIKNRKSDDHWWLLLMAGLVGLGAGLIALLYPALTGLVLILLIGANALVTGILDLIIAVSLRRRMRGVLLLVLSGIASILFGTVVFLYPLGAGALALVWIVGIYAITTGLLLFILALRVRAWAHLESVSEAHGIT